MSLRDQILGMADATSEIVEVPEWKLDVEVRSMSGAARAAIVQAGAIQGQLPDMAKFTSDIVVMCTFDPETGEQVFAKDDAELVMDKNGGALERIVTVAMRLSGFSKDAIDAAGKGSSSTPKEGSSSS